MNLQVRKDWVFRVQGWHLHVIETLAAVEKVHSSKFSIQRVVHSWLCLKGKCVWSHVSGAYGIPAAFSGSGFRAGTVRLGEAPIHRDLEKRGRLPCGGGSATMCTLRNGIHPEPRVLPMRRRRSIYLRRSRAWNFSSIFSIVEELDTLCIRKSYLLHSDLISYFNSQSYWSL